MFPDCSILFCTFHVRKWIRGVISNVVNDDGSSINKYELNRTFGEMIYARDEEQFVGAEVKWRKMIDGIKVKKGTGDQVHFDQTLEKYYDENWGNCIPMWARHSRRNIPIGTEHTNNRIENAFGKIKADLKLNNTKDVTIEMAILQLVQWAEDKLDYRYVVAQRKRLQIQDLDNPELVQVYIEAAEELNDTGCLALKKSLDLMKKNGDKMEVVQGGVEEKVTNSKAEDDFSDDENDIDEDVEQSQRDTRVIKYNTIRFL